MIKLIAKQNQQSKSQYIRCFEGHFGVKKAIHHMMYRFN